MSTFAAGEVECPACQTRFEVQLATSINVTRSPEHGVAIRDGSFHMWRCPACGERFEAIGAFVYLDFDERVMIGVHPAGDLHAWREREKEVEAAFAAEIVAGAGSPLPRLADGFVVRTVFGLPWLREKLVALDAGLDDAVVELVKIRLQLHGECGGALRLTAVDNLAMTFVDDRPSVHRVGWTTYDALAARPPGEVLVALTAGSWRDARRVLTATA